MPNIEDPRFDEPRDQQGFIARRARLSRQAGSERLGPSLRTPQGWRDLTQGEVVAFPRGEHGAHQIANRTQESVRFLAFSTNGEPDIVLYPDSGKISAAERRPDGGGIREIFLREQAVDYYEGEQPQS